MKKSLLFVIVLAMAANLFAGTKTVYCKMEQSWWKTDGAAVGAHYWGGTGGTAWPGLRMTPVVGETDLWSIDIDDSNANIIFTRVNPSGTIADWGAKTANLIVPTDGKNLFTITSPEPVWGDPGCIGEWSTYGGASTDPSVTLSISSNNVFVGDALTLRATSANVIVPVYGYHVQAPGAGSFVNATSPYTVSTEGDYLFVATVAESGAPSTILDGDTILVNVAPVPTPITVKVKLGESLSEWNPANGMYFYNWNAKVEGNFVEAVVEGEWYTYTFERMPVLNFIAVNGGIFNPDVRLQSVNVEGLNASDCYLLGNGSEVEGDGESWKKTMTIAECGTTPTIIVSAATGTTIYSDNGFIFAEGDFRIYNIAGQDVTKLNGSLKGAYIVKVDGKASKIMVR